MPDRVSSRVEPTTSALPLDSEIRGPRTNVRWIICTLLFFATTINYVDRAVIGVHGRRAHISWRC
jgi:hypothetical protein